MKSLSLIIILICLSFFHGIYGQEKFEFDSGKLIEAGIEEYQKGNFKSAITLYSKVPEGDTNYYPARYELGLALMQDSQIDRSIELFRSLRDEYKQENRQILLNLGTLYHHKNDINQSVAYYDTAIQQYPHDHRPYYEKAVVYIQENDWDNAIINLEQALLRNPFHYRSHLVLGYCYSFQGRMSEAFIVLQHALLQTSDVDEARNALSGLSSIANQEDNITQSYQQKDEKYDHPLFDEMDELINSRLALSRDFKQESSFDDPIVRQLQVIMEKAKYDPSDDNFVMQYYLPMLIDIRQKKLFDAYVLYLFSEFGIEEVDKVAGSKKGRNKIAEITDIYQPYHRLILGTRERNYSKRKLEHVKYMYIPEESIFIEGSPKDHTFSEFKKGFVRFYRMHNIMAEGEYNDRNQKNGLWKYYYPDGSLKSEEMMKDGKLVGAHKVYFTNGNLDYTLEHDHNGIFQKRRDYNYGGRLTRDQEKLGADKLKVKYFHPNGKESHSITYTGKDFEKEADGTYRAYDLNGNVSKEFMIKDQKRQGLYKEYDENGKLLKQASYNDGKLSGETVYYFPSGKTDRKYTYQDDKIHGTTIDYFEFTDNYYTQQFDQGVLHGLVEHYNKDKQKYATIQYNRGVPVYAEFMDLKGNVISKQENQNGLSKLDIFSQYGIRVASYGLDSAGELHGKCMKYYDFGGLKSEEPYDHGQLHGEAKYYYKNGQVSAVRQYQEGIENGFYQSFDQGGNKEYEGWIHEGRSLGVWTNKFFNGNIYRKYFIQSDMLNGWDQYYYVNGCMKSRYKYDNDVLTRLQEFDSTGQMINDIHFPKGNGVFISRYPNGNIRQEGKVAYGNLSGEFKFYTSDQVLVEEKNYVQNMLEGAYLEYYPTGQLMTKGQYENDKKEGQFYSYDVWGNIESETFYVDGEEHGMYKFYSFGELRYQIPYLRDHKHGKMYVYGDKGQIAGILYYDENLLIGYTYLDKDGKELDMIAVPVGTSDIQTFYSNGNKALDWHFDRGEYHGSQKIYYTNGILAEDRNFDYGLRQGDYKRWYPDGTKQYEADYDHNNPQGWQNYYNDKGELIESYPYKDHYRYGDGFIQNKDGTRKKMFFYYGER